MSAPVIASLVLVGLMFLKVGLQGVLPNKVFLALRACRRHHNRAVD